MAINACDDCGCSVSECECLETAAQAQNAQSEGAIEDIDERVARAVSLVCDVLRNG